MVVIEYAVLDTYITSVLDYYGVCDRVASCNIFCRIGCLGNAQLSLSILCCYCSGSLDLLRIIAAECCCIGSYSIDDLAGINVFLRYFICVSEDLRCSRSEYECLVRQICVVIYQLAVLDIHITDILDLNFVCYSIANCNI